MVKFVRLERVSTGSWLTLELPRPLPLDEADNYIRKELNMVGWEVVVEMVVGYPRYELKQHETKNI